MINYLTGRAELRVISNFIDGHHFYNRSSNVHSSNSQSSFNTHHQSSTYLTNHNNKYSSSSSSNYDHHPELKSSTDFHSLSYGGHLNTNEDDENQFDDELFERDDQTKELIVSVLTIDGVRPSDSGDYACKPSYAEFANCTVQILKDGKCY